MENQKRCEQIQDPSTSSIPLTRGSLRSSQRLPRGRQEKRLKYPRFQAYIVRHSKNKRTLDRQSALRSDRVEIRQQKNKVRTS
jgi:hypothetical protein